MTNAISEESPAEIVIACTDKLPYTMKIDSGANTGYKMANGSETIAYKLFSDSAHATVLDTTSKLGSGTGTGANENIKVYGQVTASQGAKAAGQYIDTVNVTVTY